MRHVGDRALILGTANLRATIPGTLASVRAGVAQADELAHTP